MKRTHTTSAGYSLIEVLIALAILAVGIVGIMQIFPVTLRQTRVAQERTVVSQTANSMLDTVSTAGGREVFYNRGELELAPLTEEVSLENPNRTPLYVARSTTAHRLPSDDDTYLQRVTVNITLPDGRVERFVTYVMEQ
ncbi:MAG: prepilin-type N-terminal cleavage/methylation domain-containing protein [Candidatus Hydrogenedentes bacterium]|nr:prepilin-type N-terminal cleavage/methylation domain-containing protein [Candidatus Hydrogenedentota bacterium]